LVTAAKPCLLSNSASGETTLAFIMPAVVVTVLAAVASPTAAAAAAAAIPLARRRFPPPPSTWWGIIWVGIKELRGFGGCNDLVFRCVCVAGETA
jgi:hypothetical protein